MWTRRSYWVLTVLAAFLFGVGVDRALSHRGPLSVAIARDQTAAMAGIERLHKLDERVTLLNDPKALQAEWTDDAVRLEPDAPVDIGKAAIYASDVRSFADSPGSAMVSYKPDIRDVQVAGEWAFEWGLFTAKYRPTRVNPLKKYMASF